MMLLNDKPTRDLSELHYRAALKRNGFSMTGIMGYVTSDDNPNIHYPPYTFWVKGHLRINFRLTLARAIQWRERDRKKDIAMEAHQ